MKIPTSGKIFGGTLHVLMMAGSTLGHADDLPKATQALLNKLNREPAVLNGLDRELAVSPDWIEKARRNPTVKVTGADDVALYAQMIKPFQERYPFIKVQYNTGSSNERVIKPLVAYRTGRSISDVVFSMDGSASDYAKDDTSANLTDLPTYRSALSAGGTRSGLKVAFRARAYCLSYNTRLVRRDQMPKTWNDLPNTEILGHGAIGAVMLPTLWMMPLWGKYGEAWAVKYLDDYFKKLKPSVRQEGINATTALVGAGELYASMPAYPERIKELQDKGAPVAWYCPDMVPLSFSSVAIFRNSPGTWSGRIFVNVLAASGRDWPWVVLLAVALMVATPLVFLILGSFSTADIPGQLSLTTLGLDNYRQVWLDRATYEVFGDTLIYVGGAASFSIVVAGILAWLVERTNMPGKIWIYACVPMTLAMPGMLQGIAWILLLSPRIGFINSLLQQTFGLTAAPFNAYTLQGMILVEGLRLVPSAFLMLVPLLRSMDPTLEEAASMSGARPISILRRVTLRLMLPGILAVVIYQAMTALEVFEVPGILGLPSKTYVFSTKIYAALHTTMGTPAYGVANSLAIIYVVIAIAAIYFYSRVVGRSERYAVVSGKGYRPRLIDLGGWRWVGLSFCVLYLLLSIIIPFLVLAYMSFLPFLQVPSANAFKMMNWNNYAELWHTEQIARVMYNTVILVLATSTLTVATSFIISLVIVRSRFWGRSLLDQLSFLPHAVPGIVLGLAFFWVFLQLDKIGISISGGVGAISIAFTVSFMAYGTRSMNAALLQIHKDLEEAAQISGASNWRVMRRVFFPLMLPSMVGLWIWAMLQAVRQAGTPLILYEGTENQVLSVFIWEMWDHGNAGVVGAVGVIMISVLLIVTLGLRAVSFGRAAST